ncbi:cytochrome P450 [Streptomyces platensis]|uniref:cytochrome P450 n=1 Tax=Streptomyces platensis TaxID=58346 RepID=UPI0037A8AF66
MAMPPRLATIDPETLDLTDPQTFLDHDLHQMWRAYRELSPVHWHAPTQRAPGFWVLSKHADVVSVYRDNKQFTSERGNVLATLLKGEDSASRKMLAVTDGPRHREIRNLMLRMFSPRVIESVVEGVRRRTNELVAHAVDRHELDFVTDVADCIPINTIGDLMDIPAADRELLVEWNTLTLSRHSSDSSELDELMARNEILLYFARLAAHRRRNPGDDVISALATATIDGEPLSEDEIVFNCYSLILGGDESSRMSSVGGLIALAQHPEQWRRLKDGEASLESATEEVLRWTTPAMHFGRRALVDVQVRDRTIRAGDVVSLWNSSANFDEDAFTDPYTFDLTRTPNKHVAFGYGPHFCLGAFLGRAHVNAMVEALRTQVGEIHLQGPPRRLFSNFVQGYSGLRVALTAEPKGSSAGRDRSPDQHDC